MCRAPQRLWSVAALGPVVNHFHPAELARKLRLDLSRITRATPV